MFASGARAAGATAATGRGIKEAYGIPNPTPPRIPPPGGGEGMSAIERKLMAAEYLLDSRAEHAHKTHCPAIGKRWLSVIDEALGFIRSARHDVRKADGGKQRTLITVQARKRPSRATAWVCDCEVIPSTRARDERNSPARKE